MTLRTLMGTGLNTLIPIEDLNFITIFPYCPFYQIKIPQVQGYYLPRH